MGVPWPTLDTAGYAAINPIPGGVFRGGGGGGYSGWGRARLPYTSKIRKNSSNGLKITPYVERLLNFCFS